MRIIISGGGTGGHIFPAIAIGRAIKRLHPEAELLYVGAEGRMEMDKVPAAGFRIEGLPVAGFDRKRLWRNIGVLLKLRRSLKRAKSIIRTFRPELAIGVGGYASGPMLKAAQRAGIPTLIQEQNSYAGVTNKLLAKKADCICVAYNGMERFFPSGKILLYGNPVRPEIVERVRSKADGRKAFGLDGDRPTLLVIGGSLGARTINEAIAGGLHKLTEAGVQVIWQTGKHYGNRAREVAKGRKGVVTTEFITNMADAYSAADLVISRAGACSLSELQLLGKPSVLVPSPNVAEDHQTKNAQALEGAGAALLIPDADASANLVDTALKLMADTDALQRMSTKAAEMALRDSDIKIAQEALKLIK